VRFRRQSAAPNHCAWPRARFLQAAATTDIERSGQADLQAQAVVAGTAVGFLLFEDFPEAAQAQRPVLRIGPD
jgi:hypothetical protein